MSDSRRRQPHPGEGPDPPLYASKNGPSVVAMAWRHLSVEGDTCAYAPQRESGSCGASPIAAAVADSMNSDARPPWPGPVGPGNQGGRSDAGSLSRPSARGAGERNGQSGRPRCPLHVWQRVHAPGSNA